MHVKVVIAMHVRVSDVLVVKATEKELLKRQGEEKVLQDYYEFGAERE